MSVKVSSGIRVSAVDLDCKKARVGCVGFDNGITPGSSSNTAGTRPNFIRFSWPLISKGVSIKGDVVGVDQLIGPSTGWTPQFTDNAGTQGKDGVDPTRWVPYFNTLLDEKSCAAFGVLPSPTWRYTKITTVDPCFSIGVWNLCRTDLESPANEYTVYPILDDETIVTVWCRDIEEKGEIKTEFYDREFVDGEEVYVEIDQPTWQPYRNAPPEPIPLDCFIPCEQKFTDLIEEGAESPCVESEFELCDFLADGTQVSLILFIQDCNGVRSKQLYEASVVANADAPLDESDEYQIQGELKNCDGSEFTEPPVATEECTIEDALTKCPSPCAESATRITIGRPANGSFSYAGVSGNSISEFESNWIANGGKAYITNQNGTGDGTVSTEAHWICPAVPGAVVLFNGAPIELPLTISPNPMAEKLGCVDFCVLQVKQLDPIGDSCERPVYTQDCPPPPCPPPSIEIYCDGRASTKYVVVSYASALCGQSGTFLADGYYASPQVLTTFEPTGTPQLCDDAVVKDSKCLIDECGNRWSCVDVITPAGGSVVESQTCVPYIAPDCGEGEGRRDIKKTAIKSLSTSVKSIKLSVTQINTQITETANPDTGEMPVPVGETCPCPCPCVKVELPE